MEKKKIYVTPACAVTELEGQEILVNNSMRVSNDPMDDITGDVNSDRGFWDIWGN